MSTIISLFLIVQLILISEFFPSQGLITDAQPINENFRRTADNVDMMTTNAYGKVRDWWTNRNKKQNSGADDFGTKNPPPNPATQQQTNFDDSSLPKIEKDKKKVVNADAPAKNIKSDATRNENKPSVANAGKRKLEKAPHNKKRKSDKKNELDIVDYGLARLFSLSEEQEEDNNGTKKHDNDHKESHIDGGKNKNPMYSNLHESKEKMFGDVAPNNKKGDFNSSVSFSDQPKTNNDKNKITRNEEQKKNSIPPKNLIPNNTAQNPSKIKTPIPDKVENSNKFKNSIPNNPKNSNRVKNSNTNNPTEIKTPILEDKAQSSGQIKKRVPDKAQNPAEIKNHVPMNPDKVESSSTVKNPIPDKTQNSSIKNSIPDEVQSSSQIKNLVPDKDKNPTGIKNPVPNKEEIPIGFKNLVPNTAENSSTVKNSFPNKAGNPTQIKNSIPNNPTEMKNPISNKSQNFSIKNSTPDKAESSGKVKNSISDKAENSIKIKNPIPDKAENSSKIKNTKPSPNQQQVDNPDYGLARLFSSHEIDPTTSEDNKNNPSNIRRQRTDGKKPSQNRDNSKFDDFDLNKFFISSNEDEKEKPKRNKVEKNGGTQEKNPAMLHDNNGSNDGDESSKNRSDFNFGHFFSPEPDDDGKSKVENSKKENPKTDDPENTKQKPVRDVPSKKQDNSALDDFDLNKFFTFPSDNEIDKRGGKPETNNSIPEKNQLNGEKEKKNPANKSNEAIQNQAKTEDNFDFGNFFSPELDDDQKSKAKKQTTDSKNGEKENQIAEKQDNHTTKTNEDALPKKQFDDFDFAKFFEPDYEEMPFKGNSDDHTKTGKNEPDTEKTKTMKSVKDEPKVEDKSYKTGKKDVPKHEKEVDSFFDDFDFSKFFDPQPDQQMMNSQKEPTHTKYLPQTKSNESSSALENEDNNVKNNNNNNDDDIGAKSSRKLDDKEDQYEDILSGQNVNNKKKNIELEYDDLPKLFETDYVSDEEGETESDSDEEEEVKEQIADEEHKKNINTSKEKQPFENSIHDNTSHSPPQKIDNSSESFQENDYNESKSKQFPVEDRNNRPKNFDSNKGVSSEQKFSKPIAKSENSRTPTVQPQQETEQTSQPTTEEQSEDPSLKKRKRNDGNNGRKNNIYPDDESFGDQSDEQEFSRPKSKNEKQQSIEQEVEKSNSGFFNRYFKRLPKIRYVSAGSLLYPEFIVQPPPPTTPVTLALKAAHPNGYRIKFKPLISVLASY